MGEMISLKESIVEKVTDKLFTKVEEHFYLTESTDYMKCDLDFDETMIFIENIYDLLERKNCIYLLKNIINIYIDDIIEKADNEEIDINIDYLIDSSVFLKKYINTISKNNINNLDIIKLIFDSNRNISRYRKENAKEIKKEKIKFLSKKGQ